MCSLGCLYLDSAHTNREASIVTLSNTLTLILIVVNSFAMFYKNRLWRNEVEHKKRERTMQLAAELRQAQKFHLIQVMTMTV